MTAPLPKSRDVHGQYVVERWEYGSNLDAPELVARLLKEDEVLLWVERSKSTATAAQFLRLGAFLLLLGAFLLLFVPWGESLDDHCGPAPYGRCEFAYYAGWPLVIFNAASALGYFWSSWHSTRRPWVITHAISSLRAFVIDERKPKKFRYIYHRLEPAKRASPGTVQFGEGRSVHFAGLDPGSADRAFYWATKGRAQLTKPQARQTS